MKQNIGTTDKIIRIILGIAIIGAGVFFQNWWGALGIIFIATALINWCPPYALLGISTRKKES